MSQYRNIQEYFRKIKTMQQQRMFMVDRNFLFINVINKAIVVTAEKVKQYVGSSGLTFKSRYTRYKY